MGETRYQQLKAAGLCGICGKEPPRPGKYTCAACAKKRCAKGSDYRQYLIGIHHCATCSKPLPKGWYYVDCPECKEWMSNYGNELRKRMKEEGRCPGCGKPLPENSDFAYCPECREDRHKYYKPRKTTNAIRFKRLFGMTAEELRSMSADSFRAWAEGGRT